MVEKAGGGDKTSNRGRGGGPVQPIVEMNPRLVRTSLEDCSGLILFMVAFVC